MRDYVYLWLVIVFGAVWGAYCFLRPDLRRKLLFSSAASFFLGFTEPLFIPGYWIPQFKAIPLGKELYLESLLFCGVLGGFCACSWQVVAGKGLFPLRKIHPALTFTAPVAFLAVYLPGGTEVPVNFAYFAGGAMMLGTGVLIGALGRETAWPILLTGLAATLIYGAIYYAFWVTFPSLPASYQFVNFSGLAIAGIPIEEFVWIFPFACCWALLYEIWRGRFPGL
ncbi:MAG: hypothetical protein AABZ64_17310 [Nitrospinota bacterium]